MLENIFLIEEEQQNYAQLFLLGILSVLLGYVAASTLFPSYAGILTVVFASAPLMYSLTDFFLEEEKERAPYMEEIEVYLSIFVGEVLAFFILGMNISGEVFSAQTSVLGISGAAVSVAEFQAILLNNLGVFTAIFGLALLLGTAGAFVLTWNASVLGIFLADLVSSEPFLTLAYIPHSLFEMSGFITAGIAGSLMSAALHREHFDRDLWIKYGEIFAVGLFFVVAGAVIEST